MAFQNKDFWMTKGASSYTEGETTYDSSSRLQPKRPHQWFLDPSESEFPNKKLAIETSNSRPISAVPNVNLPWETQSSFHSINQVNDRLFGSEPPRTIDFGARNFHSGTGPLDVGRRGIEYQFGNDAPISLTMSHTMEDPGPCLSYGGIRKVKVSEVKDPDLSIDVGVPIPRADHHTLSFDGFQEDPRMNPLSSRLNHVTDSDSGMPIQMANSFNRGNGNTISFSGFQEQPGSRLGELKHCGSGMTIPTFTRGDCNSISFNAFQEEPGTNPLSSGGNQVRDSDNVLHFMGTTFSKVDSNTISFGGFPVQSEMKAPSGRLISNYDSLICQTLVQPSETSKEKEFTDPNSSLVVNATPLSTATTEAPKNKTEPKVSKKLPPNNFPSNVRSLLSTGILDGVSVKYISWSREELAGMIKGSGYLCGCQSCQYSKVLNAYEFERHAGCKTKHPNNHIFFENGKTIYGIVQELRSTPQNMLFEAIQTITGSPINEKAFRVWKASFEAATRELQRIYGKDEIDLTSRKES